MVHKMATRVTFHFDRDISYHCGGPLDFFTGVGSFAIIGGPRGEEDLVGASPAPCLLLEDVEGQINPRGFSNVLGVCFPCGEGVLVIPEVEGTATPEKEDDLAAPGDDDLVKPGYVEDLARPGDFEASYILIAPCDVEGSDCDVPRRRFGAGDMRSAYGHAA